MTRRKRRTVAKYVADEKRKPASKATVPKIVSGSGQGPADAQEAGPVQQANNQSSGMFVDTLLIPRPQIIYRLLSTIQNVHPHSGSPTVVLPSAEAELSGMPAIPSKGHSTDVDLPEAIESENNMNSGSHQVTTVIPEGELLLTPWDLCYSGGIQTESPNVDPPEVIRSDNSINSHSYQVTTVIPDGKPSLTPWDLCYIQTKSPNDLTGYVTREEHPFAAGGFADIYEGIFHVHGESIKVAVKAIKTYSTDDKESKKLKRIRREVAVWFTLDHPNVLPLFGTSMSFGKLPAMVCPWAENGTLTSYLDHNVNLATSARLALLYDVSAGLQYLHEQSVVHGDLSGSNVLIYATGRACIADFGLSTLLNELGLGSMFITSFQGKGTIRWTAPELFHLHEDDDKLPNVVATQQSDVFSFGSIMLQILSGKVPYHYFTRDEPILMAISKGVMPKRPTEGVVTDCRWEFIGQCWSWAPHSRPSGDVIVEFTRNELANELANEQSEWWEL